MPTLTADLKATLLQLADMHADELASEYGRARIGAPTYSAGDARHGFWSVAVTGMTDDVERARRRVFIDGTFDDPDAPTDEASPPAGYDVESGAPGDWTVWRQTSRRRVYVTQKDSREKAIAAAHADSERRREEMSIRAGGGFSHADLRQRLAAGLAQTIAGAEDNAGVYSDAESGL